MIGLVTSEVLTRCGCDQINKLLSSRRSQSIKLHITQNLRGGVSRHLDFSQSEWLRRREALSLHWSGTVWRAKLKHEEQRYTLPHEGKWGNYSCRNHENTEAMRTVASNPRANRSITLSTNAGHNAGQRAARAAENAGNGGNFFFFFFGHNDMLVCQDGQRPWCDFKLSLLHEQRDWGGPRCLTRPQLISLQTIHTRPEFNYSFSDLYMYKI